MLRRCGFFRNNVEELEVQGCAVMFVELRHWGAEEMWFFEGLGNCV